MLDYMLSYILYANAGGQMEAKFRSEANRKNWRPIDFPGGQIFGIWPPGGQSGNPGRTLQKLPVQTAHCVRSILGELVIISDQQGRLEALEGIRWGPVAPIVPSLFVKLCPRAFPFWSVCIDCPGRIGGLCCLRW